ncbi:alpha/beta fold hydrolase [Yunchengibacter salinarum]|uniref:alpha/beta fold hydrolase n=1 Tax=Yunchengibacter salinarum TaxID=3133399 RepID=UPI0035B5B9E5
MDLFYRVKGDGPPVLLLHGLFGSADNLGALARSLEDDHRVVAVDLRNHGRSPHSDSMTYADMAADVLAVMDREGIDTADVFGHSMGGKVAMQMALSKGDRVRHLIVGDIAPVAYGRHHDRILEGLKAVDAARPNSRGKAQKMLAAYEKEPAIQSFLVTNWRRDTDSGAWGWRINLDGIIDNYEHIMDAVDGDSFNGPVLFIKGSESDYLTNGHRKRIMKLFPKATLRTVEGAGHWFHAEKPALTARLVRRFLDHESQNADQPGEEVQ